MMSEGRAFLAATFAAALIVPHVSPAGAQMIPRRIDVPVMAGGDGDYDSCNSVGQIVGLNPRGDGFLSVRSGPGGSRYREIDRLYNGNQVFVCDNRGPWLGVVYPAGGGRDCGVATPWPVRQPYTGPCLYGWIHSRYVRIVAG